MVFAFDRFELDGRLFELRHAAGSPIPLQPKVLDLLLMLVRHAGRVVTKEELRASLWPGVVVGETSLNRAVLSLRRALDDDAQKIVGTVRGRGFRVLVPVREIEPERPVRVLESETTDPGTIALEVTIDPPLREPLIGREGPFAACIELLERAISGETLSVVVVGEPGIGKTRFVDDIAAAVRARGAVALVARCSREAGAPSFWPWVRVVRRFRELCGDRALEASLGDATADVARILPDVVARVSPPSSAASLASADAPEKRFRAFDGFARFLRRATEAAPIAIIIDDLHHADVPSLQLLRFLVRELHDTRLLVVVAHREGGAQGDREVSDALTGLIAETTHSIRLRGLAREDIARIVAVATGATPSSALTQVLYDRTAGNPFFLTHLLHLFKVEGRLHQLEELAVRDLAEGFPDGMRDAILRYLTVLSTRSREILAVAARVGREFGVGLLSRVLDIPPAQLLPMLEEAVAVRVLSREDPSHFRFAQRLVQEALADAVPADERMSIHRRIADALIERTRVLVSPPHARIAAHVAIAAPLGESQRAIEYELLAARQAISCAAYEEAWASCRRALDLVEQYGAPPALTVDALLALGDARHWGGDEPGALEAFLRAGAIAREHGDAKRLASAAFGFAAVEETGIVDAQRIRFLEEGIEAIGAHDDAARAVLMARLSEALYFTDQEQRRVSLARQAVEVARRCGDQRSIAFALKALHFVISFPDTLTERINIASELRVLGEAADDVELQILGTAAQVRDAIEVGELDVLDAAIAAHARLLVRFPRPHFGLYQMLYRGARALVVGALGDAENWLGQAMSSPGATGNPLAGMWFGVQTFVLRREQGRLEELRPLLEATSAGLPDFVCWRAALAYLDAISGRHEEARAALHRFVVDGALSIRRDINWLVAIAIFAEVVAETSDPTHAQLLYDALLPHRSAHVLIGLGIASHGAVSRYLGLLASVLGRGREAEAHLLDALSIHRRNGQRPFEAYCAYELARYVALPASDARRASLHAEHAHALASSIGMPLLAARAAALTRSLMSETAPQAPRLHAGTSSAPRRDFD